jgi:RHS repeat-associated protein
MMSASPVGNFYIYSFDGKLLQVYDVYGHLLKDYIYMGGRLIAEYDYVGARFLYYTPDQINTTRVITDQGGNVVYSAVHDPYGGIQQTGAGNTYDPQLKFSGKERDSESQLDYFGARYYDRSQYRFISLDPASFGLRSNDPQLLNSYSFAKGNPLSYIETSGRFPVSITVTRTGYTSGWGVIGTFIMITSRGCIVGSTIEPPLGGSVLAQKANSNRAILAGTYGGYLGPETLAHGQKINTIILKGVLLGSRTDVCFHEGSAVGDTTGCIGVGDKSVRKAMYDLVYGEMMIRVNLAIAAMSDVNPVALSVIEAFLGLPSAAWFPEFDITIIDGPGMFLSLPDKYVCPQFC